MNRLDGAFTHLKQQGEPGLVTYITAGDPDLARTAELLRALPAAGADVVEVGVPFSDPMADGPVIQRASERALRSGTTMSAILEMLVRERSNIDAPIVLFTYANPVERMGYAGFIEAAAAAGVDGVLVLDLPIDEAGTLADGLKQRRIAPVFLVSPTTPAARIARAASFGSGFLYAISRLGVTGAQQQLSGDASSVVRAIRAVSSLPVALGFGISTPEQVKAACALADAAVVGSALVQVIGDAAAESTLVERACAQVSWLKGRA